MTWNYRIVTHVVNGRRYFSITEVYYNNKPESYIDPKEINIFSFWESTEDMNGTLSQIKEAVTKPIIDLDNFPKIYSHE